MKSVSDSCPHPKITKESSRKTEFKVTSCEGLKIVICFTLELSNADT